MQPGWIDEPFYSEIKRVTPIPCVDLLILYDEKLLLMKRRNPPGKGLWFTPGGRVYKGESLEEAVTRVLLKETGLEPITITQIGAMSHIWPEAHTVTVFYIVKVDSDSIQMNDEHEDYKWINEIKDLHPYIIHMIKTSNILNS